MVVTHVPLHLPLFRGERALRLALVGLPRAGKSDLFEAVASANPHSSRLAGTYRAYRDCLVRIGFDEARVIDMPGIESLHGADGGDTQTIKFLLWGDQRPPVSAHEADGAPAPFGPPDVLVQVLDAGELARHFELTLELSQLGRPLVLALNYTEEAVRKGLSFNTASLTQALGIPVVPVTVDKGLGLTELFEAAVAAARERTPPRVAAASPHIMRAMAPLEHLLHGPGIARAFALPTRFLALQLAAGDRYLAGELAAHFPKEAREAEALCREAAGTLPRELAEELHADRHHRAAMLFETAIKAAPFRAQRNWAYWLDELFLHRRWGLIGSLATFAAVLFVVLEVSSWIDSHTSARLVEWLSDWKPGGVEGIIARAVVDGLVGLLGIVLPYMLPLVLLLVALEEIGLMQRVAFVVDRAFHKIGLHGGLAVPFLLGLGCNVPAISAAGRVTADREKVIAATLISLVPCSARSAIVLAIAGKYLGASGVLAIFAFAFVAIAATGRLLARTATDLGPGQLQSIPPYRWPRPGMMLRETVARTSDILTIVTPLLVGGSVVLALLAYWHADTWINLAFTPITSWWLGLPAVLGVPILFGVLRKELSLLMIYQALGTFELNTLLSTTQITTFLLFLMFYVPCISTYAVMNTVLGRRRALSVVGLCIGLALIIAGVARVVLGALNGWA